MDDWGTRHERTSPVYGSDTFYITPANYANFSEDQIDGNGAANDTLMFMGDGNITLGYNSTANAQFPGNADIVTFNSTPLVWPEGHNISTIGVQTMGGTDKVTIDPAGSNGFGTAPSSSAKLGSWTSAIRIVDGGFANIPGLDGNVLIDDTAFTEQATLLGGVGNDTIMIDNMATGSLVEGGSGNNQQNELDIIGDSGPVDIIEGINNLVGSATTGNPDLEIDGTTWIGAANCPETCGVRLHPSTNTTSQAQTPENDVTINGSLIPQAIIEGGSGTEVTNDFTAYNGTNTLVGGNGTDAINDFTAVGGTNTMIGGGGTNTLTRLAAPTHSSAAAARIPCRFRAAPTRFSAVAVPIPTTSAAPVPTPQ